MNKKQIIIIISFILIILLCGYYLFTFFFEKKSIERKSFPSIEAIKNPFLAADRFLNSIGIDAQSVSERKRIIDLPPENHMLILNSLGPNLPEKSFERLVTWMNNGGILVASADKVWNEKDNKSGNNLLDYYDIRLKTHCGCKNNKTDKNDDKKERKKKTTEKSSEEKSLNKIVDIKIFDDDTAKISFIKNRSLSSTNEKADKEVENVISDENSVHMVQKTIGDGKLIIFSDIAFLRNSSIGEHDHAFFLANLAKSSLKVWFVYSSAMPSLFYLVTKNAPFFCICFVILFLFSLMRLNFYSGPILKGRDESNRDITEFLSASAGFLWKVNKISSILKIVQKELVLSLAKKYPQLTNIKPLDISAIMAQKTNLSKSQVYSALYENHLNEQNIVNKAKTLQKLSMHLKKHIIRKD